MVTRGSYLGGVERKQESVNWGRREGAMITL